MEIKVPIRVVINIQTKTHHSLQQQQKQLETMHA